MKITIEQKTSEGSEKTLHFEDRSPISIGRSKENDVVFNAPEHRIVSSIHAHIFESDGRVFIEDNKSLNGLFVDDRQVTKAELEPHSAVQLGQDGPRFEVTIEGLELKSSLGTRPMPELPEKKYGDKTVGMMIKQALAQVRITKVEGTTKSTGYLEALMDSKIRRTSLRLRGVLILLGLLIIAIGVGIALYVRHNRSVQYIQTTQVNYGEAAGSAIAAANRYSVFLMAGQAKNAANREGFCTAFAVGQSVLATNAHCIDIATKRYGDVTVVMNGAPSNWYTVNQMVPHPGYQDGQLSPDVGLIVIGGRLTHLTTMATKAELARLAPGVPAFLYGFPGRLNRLEAPEATFISGQIGRVTGFDQRHGQFGDNTLLQHSAFSSQGTSGSPIFNADGRVIGINTGGYMEAGQVLPGYNFGMRIDLIDSLLAGIEK